MNRGAIRTQAAAFAGDVNQTRFGGKYEDAIDKACEEFAFDSRALFKDAATITTVDGTATYDLPSDFWYEKIVTHKGLELRPISRATLLRDNGDDWTDDAGTPTRYIIDPEEARKQIRLYRKPQSGDAGANLILTYYPIPAAMAADSDTPFNGSALMAQFHLGVAAYAAWLVLSYEELTPAIIEKRRSLYALYQGKVDMAIDRFGNTPKEVKRIQPNRRYRSRP